jgi:hypothetical protein
VYKFECRQKSELNDDTDNDEHDDNRDENGKESIASMIEHRLLSSHSVRDRRRRKKKEREERSQRNDKEKCVRRENDIFIPMKFFSFCQDINS